MFNPDPKGLYARLGVAPTASASEIKAAYRQLVKQHHPDLNATSDASARFRALNEAYQTLSDASQRAAYDSLQYEAPRQESPARTIEPICCCACGKVAAQPRPLVFWYVVSLVFVTLRNPIQGIYCAACARKTALRATAISAFAGWWGFPWGPIYTIGGILRNSTGGVRQPDTEERLLWYNAMAFSSKGDYDLSYALARKLRTSRNEETALRAVRHMDLLQKNKMATPALAYIKDAWHHSFSHVFAHVLLLAALPLVALCLIYQTEIRRTVSMYQVPQAATLTPQESIPIERPVTSTFSPTFKSAEPIKAASIAPAMPPCRSIPFNGQVLAGRTSASRGHVIEIKNGSNGNAIVKVRNSATGRLVVSFFVAQDRSASLGGLADGEYRFQYAIGDQLSSNCRSFSQPAATNQFPDAESLVTRRANNSIIRKRLTYTLYSVPDGNIRPEYLDGAAFEAD